MVVDAESELVDGADVAVAALVSSARTFAGEASLSVLQPTTASIPMPAVVRTRTIEIIRLTILTPERRPGHTVRAASLSAVFRLPLSAVISRRQGRIGIWRGWRCHLLTLVSLVMISHPSDERWIKTVPSEIVWLTFTGFVNAAQCRHVPLARGFAKHQFTECR